VAVKHDVDVNVVQVLMLHGKILSTLQVSGWHDSSLVHADKTVVMSSLV